jgi:hypothetical protein
VNVGNEIPGNILGGSVFGLQTPPPKTNPP